VTELIGELTYLYTGSADVESDVRFYLEGLGGILVGRAKAMGTEVAAVRLGPGPLVLLAEHRPAPSVLPIWSCSDIDATQKALEAAGYRVQLEVEVPDGPVLVLKDPSGNELALLDRVRPNAMLSHTQDPPG
jgi:predicted enzyme related to lactoylglutathione lyase